MPRNMRASCTDRKLSTKVGVDDFYFLIGDPLENPAMLCDKND